MTEILKDEHLKILSQIFTDIPFNKMLGVKLEHISKDAIEMRFAMKPELVGNFVYGILHGGVISSVLDMAGGMNVMATAFHKHSDRPLNELAAILTNCSTIDLHINYLRPGRGHHFIAKAFIQKSGKQISFTRMELWSDENKLIATANGAYLLKSSYP